MNSARVDMSKKSNRKRPPFKQFGMKFREFRERAILRSLEYLSTLASVSKNFLYYIERGERRPGPATLRVLCDVLELERQGRDELFTLAEYQTSEIPNESSGLQRVTNVLENIPPDEREAAIGQIEDLLVRWTDYRKARNKRISV